VRPYIIEALRHIIEALRRVQPAAKPTEADSRGTATLLYEEAGSASPGA